MDGFELRRLGRDRFPVAVFVGNVPTMQQWDLIRQEGWGLNLLGSQVPDLTFLEHGAGFLKKLELNVSDELDTSPVGTLVNLEKLSVYSAPPQPVDLSELQSLKTFSGQHSGYESIARCRALTTLILESPIVGALEEIEAPLESLELSYAKRVKSLPVIRDRSRLKTLSIDGTTTISLKGLEAHDALERLILFQCRRVTDAGELIEHAPSQLVSFQSCRVVEPHAALLQLADLTVYVRGVNTFDEEFRILAAGSRATWDFTEAKRPAS